MLKFGVVKKGVTPSCISGKSSSLIYEEEAFASEEEKSRYRKISESLFNKDRIDQEDNIIIHKSDKDTSK